MLSSQTKGCVLPLFSLLHSHYVADEHTHAAMQRLNEMNLDAVSTMADADVADIQSAIRGVGFAPVSVVYTLSRQEFVCL